MNKQINLRSILVPTLSGLLLAASIATPAKAATTEENNNVKAPVVLAYYYGPGYYHHGPYWRGYRPAVVCPRTCWRGAWGYLHCVRRC